MKEFIFLIEDDPFVGFTAKGLGESIFTEAENWEQLKENINEAVKCHFGKNEMLNIIRLHYVKDEVIEIAS